MLFIHIAILTLLTLTAVTVARIRDLWAAVMFTGIYSFLSASWMLALDAPDVAFTEAAVGAGISTFLMLSTLALTSRKEKPTTGSAVRAFAHCRNYRCSFDLRNAGHAALGDPQAPVHTHPSVGFMERAQPDMHGLPNVVTAVLASYRGYDTLGETAVIFTAGIAVLLDSKEAGRGRRDRRRRNKRRPT